jgi:hypothetical protein
MAGQHFHRDGPVELDLPGAINHAHAAAAELALDFVSAEEPVAGSRSSGGSSRAWVRRHQAGII